MRRYLLWILLAPVCAFGLEIGSEAPALRIAKWYNGGPVTFAPGKVYVIEFWATWCAPCKVTMPHLSALQKSLGGDGLTVVGITNEAVDTVEKFLGENPGMDYIVAVDDEKKTSAVWMEGVPGIPHAFVVDKEGMVAWKGHPLSGMDLVIERILTGAYGKADREAARKVAELEERLQGELRANKLEEAVATCLEVLKLDPGREQPLDLLFRIYEHRRKPKKELYARLGEAFAGKAEAMAHLAVLIASQQDLGDRDLSLAVKNLKQAQKEAGRRASDRLLLSQARLEYLLGLPKQAAATAVRAAKAAKLATAKERAEAEAAYYASALEAQKELKRR